MAWTPEKEGSKTPNRPSRGEDRYVCVFVCVGVGGRTGSGGVPTPTPGRDR